MRRGCEEGAKKVRRRSNSTKGIRRGMRRGCEGDRDGGCKECATGMRRWLRRGWEMTDLLRITLSNLLCTSLRNLSIPLRIPLPPLISFAFPFASPSYPLRIPFAPPLHPLRTHFAFPAHYWTFFAPPSQNLGVFCHPNQLLGSLPPSHILWKRSKPTVQKPTNYCLSVRPSVFMSVPPHDLQLAHWSPVAQQR